MAEFSMDQFEQDYRNERRKALRDSVKSGKTSLPVGILQHGANRLGESVSDTVQGIGAFAKSLYNNPQAVAESGAEGLEALYNRVAQEDPMAAMQVAQMVASGGTGAAILRGGRIDPSAVGSGGGNIIRGFHSTRKDFDEIDPERGLPTGNFGQAAYFSESNDYPSRLNPNSRIIEADLDTTDFLQAGKKIPVAKERVLGTLSVLNSLEDATGKPFKVEYDADTNTALVEYNRRRRAGEEGPIKETKTFDFNNSSKLFDDIKSVTWGLRYESMSTDRTNLSDFMRAAGFTGVKGGSDDDFHIGVFDKSAVKQFAQGGPVMRGIGTLNETARNMFRGPRGIGAYQQLASGGEAMGPPPTRGPDPQGIGAYQQFADGGPVYMKEGGDQYRGLINKYSERNGVDPEIAYKMFGQESNFDNNAESPKGALGFAQVMPKTAKQPGFGVKPLTDFSNVEEGIRFGTEYLAAMLDRFNGNYDLALAGYNAGFGEVEKYGGVPPFLETQKHILKILGRFAPDAVQGKGGKELAESLLTKMFPDVEKQQELRRRAMDEEYTTPVPDDPMQRSIRELFPNARPFERDMTVGMESEANLDEAMYAEDYLEPSQTPLTTGEELRQGFRPSFGSQAQQDDFEAMTPQNISMRERYSSPNMAAELVGGEEALEEGIGGFKKLFMRPKLRPPSVEFGEDKGGVFRSLMPPRRKQKEYPRNDPDALFRGLGKIRGRTLRKGFTPYVQDVRGELT